MGRQSGLQLLATPSGGIVVGEAEVPFFRSIVADLRSAIEDLSRLEGSTDVARLSRTPSSSFPAWVPTVDNALFDAWDRMMPGERSTLILAVLDDSAGLRAPGDAQERCD